MRDVIAGAKTSVEGFLANFPSPILLKIDWELTIQRIIDLHRLISGNAASVSLNLKGGRHEHLALTTTHEDYASQTGFAFVPLHNPGDYPPTTGNAQYQALGTEKFRQNHALFRKYTAVDGALKKQIIKAVEPVFLYPLVDQLTGFG